MDGSKPPDEFCAHAVSRLEIVTISSPAIHYGRTDESVAAATAPVSANFRFVVGRHAPEAAQVPPGFWFSMLSGHRLGAHLAKRAQRSLSIGVRLGQGPRCVPTPCLVPLVPLWVC